MLEQAKSLADQLSAWRQDFHKHPELGFREFRTAGVVARTLGGDYTLEIRSGCPSTVNHADVVTMIKDV